jgi:kynurenine formamidase
VPVDRLVLRPTTVVRIAKSEGEAINRPEIEKALDAARPQKGDLIATGWGDRPYGESYLSSPHLSLEAAQHLASKMNESQSGLLLIDTALIGWPDKYLIPEWCSMLPLPAAESAEARMYLHLYNGEKARRDYAVEMERARVGTMTVRKLVHAKMIVLPLQIKKGGASPCRFIAVEE